MLKTTDTYLAAALSEALSGVLFIELGHHIRVVHVWLGLLVPIELLLGHLLLELFFRGRVIDGLLKLELLIYNCRLNYGQLLFLLLNLFGLM